MIHIETFVDKYIGTFKENVTGKDIVDGFKYLLLCAVTLIVLKTISPQVFIPVIILFQWLIGSIFLYMITVVLNMYYKMKKEEQ